MQELQKVKKSRTRSLPLAGVIVLLVGLLGNSRTAASQSVVRGPYLQQGTPSSVVVRWRTDVATDSVVEYGTSVLSYDRSASTAGTGTEHEVALTSLQPATRYFYRIKASGNVIGGGTADYFYVSAPSAGDASFKAWIVGDAGTSGYLASGEDPHQAAVRDAFLAKYPVGSFQLFLMLGDNAYDTGTDSQYQRAVFDPYAQVLRNTVTWPTQGNHDITGNAYYSVFTMPTAGESGGVASGTEQYYSFDYSNAHFISLNTELTDSTFRSSMLTWLQQDLAGTTKDWIVVFFHHPPYSKGSHDSDNVGDSGGRMTWARENLLPVLEAGGADLVLAGHSHSYERSKFIDGHYGVSSTFAASHVITAGDGHDDAHNAYTKSSMGKTTHAGAVYVTAGNSGGIQGGSLDHPAMIVSLNHLGSMSLEVNGNELNASMVNSDGGVDDYFTLRKSPNRPRKVGGLSVASSTDGCGMNVSWTVGSGVTTYRVYRSTSADPRGSEVGSVAGSVGTFKDTTAQKDVSYYYTVRAENASGIGPWADASNGVVTGGTGSCAQPCVTGQKVVVSDTRCSCGGKYLGHFADNSVNCLKVLSEAYQPQAAHLESPKKSQLKMTFDRFDKRVVRYEALLSKGEKSRVLLRDAKAIERLDDRSPGIYTVRYRIVFTLSTKQLFTKWSAPAQIRIT
jgi:hypothetical protein